MPTSHNETPLIDVIPGLDPGIHAFCAAGEDVDGRVKPGHDDLLKCNGASMQGADT